MRTLKELYEMLWDEIQGKDYIPSICNEIEELYDFGPISLDEWQCLKGHFLSQRFLHPEFMTEERNWCLSPNSLSPSSLYWWKDVEDENPINRKAFIQKIISTL